MGLHTTNPPPTSPTHGPNRYKTLPARPKTPKSGHFSRAGRIFSRFQHQSTTHPVQNSPSNSHPRAQPVQNSPSNTHPLAQPVQNSPSTPTINEIRPFQARRENFLPVPPTRNRAGRTFSRFQHQSTTHPVQNSPRNTHLKAHPVQNSPSNTHPLAQPVQNSPGTPKNTEIRPFLASRENFLPLPTPIHHSPGTKLSRQQPPPGPTGTKLSPHAHLKAHPAQNSPRNSRPRAQPVQNSPSTPKNTKIRPFQARRENFLPLPTPRHRAGRISSRFQHQSTTHPVQNSPSNSHPLARPVQNSPHTPTSRLTRHKTLPATAAPGPNRYKTLPARPKTPKSGHFKRAGRISSRFQHHATEQGEFPPASNTNPPLTRYKTLPATPTPGPNRYKTLPARPKTPKFGHFSRAGRILSRFHHHATEQGEFSPVSNTTLVPISTQLTDWSPLSPRHQTNAPLSWALCGLSAAHHDVAPERAGTDRRLADWNWPRHTQASSEQLNPEQARLA